MGRGAAGVRGMTLEEGDEVVGMEVLVPQASILTVSANGYGKRTELSKYPLRHRGGKGVITIRTTDRNGPVVGVGQVGGDDDVMIITSGGKLIRLPAAGLRTIGRATEGVRLISLAEGERVVSMARLAEKDGENGGKAEGEGEIAESGGGSEEAEDEPGAGPEEPGGAQEGPGEGAGPGPDGAASGGPP
jgi:DNA gyrase subunit A